MARVNVSDEAWEEFRVRVLRARSTVADYLGELVKKELQRQAPKPPAPPVVVTRQPLVPPAGAVPLGDRSRYRLASSPPPSPPTLPPLPAPGEGGPPPADAGDELPLDLPPGPR